MDPQETLARFYAARAAAEEADETAAAQGQMIHDTELALQLAVDAASELFEWLAKGGFAPDWSAVRKVD